MKKIILLFAITLFSSFAWAQIGINTENPNKFTELDIKNVVNGNDTIPKGILIPRMTEKQRNLINVADKLLVNGLLIYNTDEDCYNYYNRLDQEWKSLCGKLGKAEFNLTDCSTVKVSGEYLTKTTLSSSNFLSIPVKVTKPGAYTITGLTSNDNGYYFTVSGEFLVTGDFLIMVPGAGSPINATTVGGTGDQVSITLNGVDSGCSVLIPIEDSSLKPLFTMNCGTTNVYGVYKVNKMLDATNYIEVTLAADVAAIGATYVVETNTVDGISFKGQGLLSSTNQTVRLYGSGTPTSTEVKQMTISSNSTQSVTTCSVRVIILIPKKRLLTIGGSKDGYGYNFSGNAASNKLITTAANFGSLAASTVKTEGFEIIDAGNAPSEANMKTWLTGSNPVDIVVIGYSYSGISVTVANYFAQYLSNKGVLLAFQDSYLPTVAGNLMNAVFNEYNNITLSFATGAGSVYQFPYLNNELLNGPFGDIRGLQWGEDATTTVRITGLPAGAIDILSGDRDLSTSTSTGTAGYVTAFKHKELNFIWFGDGGFNSNDGGTSATICPFNLNGNNFPIGKPNYGRGTDRYTVYNSVFTANAMVWALHQAEFNGINTR